MLGSGQVQLTGGFDVAYAPVRTTYLYNPATGTWTAGRPMLRARAGHTATVLSNGQVLVAGGTVTGGAATDTAETYNPLTTSWSLTAVMPLARTRQSAVSLPAPSAGRVLLVGGNDGSSGLRPTALYNQATRTWTAGPSLLRLRSSEDVGDPTVTSLADGRVLVAGGYDAAVLSSAEIYTPSSNAFTLTGSLRFATEGGHTATLLADGRVLLAGGTDDWGGLATTQLYSPATGTWSRGNDLLAERAGQAAVRLPSGAVLLVGGYRWLPTYVSVATAAKYQP